MEWTKKPSGPGRYVNKTNTGIWRILKLHRVGGKLYPVGSNLAVDSMDDGYWLQIPDPPKGGK